MCWKEIYHSNVNLVRNRLFSNLFWLSLICKPILMFRNTCVWVHLVFQPPGIAPTFLKLDSWSPLARGGFYSYYIHQRNISDKERKIVWKKLSFKHTKRFNTFSLKWVQSRVGAIPLTHIGSRHIFMLLGDS